MVSVNEATDWNVRGSVQSKYRAMSCHINCLDVDDPEYITVKNKAIESQIKYYMYWFIVVYQI